MIFKKWVSMKRLNAVGATTEKSLLRTTSMKIKNTIALL